MKIHKTCSDVYTHTHVPFSAEQKEVYHSCKHFNCLCDSADRLQGHEPIFPAELRAARGGPAGLLLGHPRPLCLCVAVRKLSTEPRFLPVQAWTAATVLGVTDTQLPEPGLASAAGCLQGRSWTGGPHQGHRDDWWQGSTSAAFPLH